MDRQQGFQQRLQQLQVQRIRAVRFCVGGIVVDLEKNSIDARSSGRDDKLNSIALKPKSGLNGVPSTRRLRRAHSGET
jgi:hypothetical protein